MADNKPIFVYDKDCTDFTTTGLVGDLQPIEATFHEEKNGMSEIEIHMPYDQLRKWAQCLEGRIIKCEVPVREPPVVINDQYQSSVNVGELT